ncbi:MAG TPA: hypothetical protein VH279_07270 [Solirubrobacteraceae bacterium]|nr:hypothetical protein [Solirubrobacteraceae bacterium]
MSSQIDWETQEHAAGRVWSPPPYRQPWNASSAKLASSIVAHTGVCRLVGFTVTSTNASAQFIQVYDAAAVPANGAIPLFTFNVALVNSVTGYWGSMGRWCDRGIVLCNSTTQGTLTIGAADTLFDVQYF